MSFSLMTAAAVDSPNNTDLSEIIVAVLRL